MNKPIANSNILDPIDRQWPGNIAENTVLTLHLDLVSINAKLGRPLVCMVLMTLRSPLGISLGILIHSDLGNFGKKIPRN